MPRSLCAALAIATGLVALPASPASARPASSGFFTEAGIGGTGFVGRKDRHTVPGPSLELRIGYDLLSWFSVGARLSGASHEADVPPPPEGEYFQVYTAHGEGRLGFRVGAVGLFAEGGAGVSMISSNILEKVNATDPGERFTLSFGGGGGIEYQLVNRHHAFGMAGSFTMYPEFSRMKVVSGRLYFRYTY